MVETTRNRVNGTQQHVDIGKYPPGQRLLLMPHCLRPPQGCPGKTTREGLDCTGCTRTDCKIGPIREAALNAGYMGVVIAPGGRLAVRRVAELRPAAIVAVACDKELEEGAAAVKALGWEGETPPIVQIPLLRDGCVNTDIDLDVVLGLIER